MTACDGLLTASFEAHNPERNHRRASTIRVGRDLLGDWTLSVRYGRIGVGGREVRYGDPDPAVLQAVVSEKLRRRLSAPARLGCPYRLTGWTTVPGFDPSGWVSTGLAARFLGDEAAPLTAGMPARSCPATP